MRSTTFIRRGDVVIHRARFSDHSGSKRRPSVIVSSAAYHRGRSEVVLANLTTNISTRLAGKYILLDWAAAGLQAASATSGDIATVDRADLSPRIGRLSPRDLAGIKEILKEILEITD